jgi:hypothetical protein
MRPECIRRLLGVRPFAPFRIFLSNGAAYDVAHPEAALVIGGALEVSLKPSGFAGPPGERTAYLSFIHISHVEVYYPGAAPAP